MGTVLILSRKQRAVAALAVVFSGSPDLLFPGSLGTGSAGLKYTINIVSSVRVRGKQIDGISSQEKAARMTNGGIRNHCCYLRRQCKGRTAVCSDHAFVAHI